MTRIRGAAAVAAVVLTLVASAGPAGAAKGGNGKKDKAVCGPPAAKTARCHAHVQTTDDGVTPLATTTYQSGFAPGQVRSAYKLSATGGAGRTVAIVDAYDNPKAESDLAAYRTRFNLPACTTANGCFRKVNQRGGTTYPAGNVGWGQEIALDLDMVSAACPSCHILLVEADSASITALGAAVREAAALHASTISNSYGTPEFSGETSYEAPYNQPGIPVTASSGDSGYGVQFPAASRYVTAVGGTHLTRNTSTGVWSETAWSGAGSGCSGYVPKPAWQTDAGCARRTVADVSAVADPNTGVAVYDSYGSSGGNNWYVFGGTSVAAPIIASVYAQAGNGAGPGYPYSHRSALRDVVGGANGTCPSTTHYLCTAVSGYDGPTGLGTPQGVAAF